MSTVAFIIVVLSVAFAIATAIWRHSQNEKFSALKAKYGRIEDLEHKLKSMERETQQRLEIKAANANHELNKIRNKEKAIKASMADDAQRHQFEIKTLKAEKSRLDVEIIELRKVLAHTDVQFELEVTNFAHPEYDLLSSERFKNMLDNIKRSQKEMIQSKTAIICSREWTIGGSRQEGEKMTNRTIRLALSSFNTQADNLILKVTFKNIDRSIERLQKLAHSINRLLEPVACVLTEPYIRSKIEELSLSYRYAERKNHEKEVEKEHREKQQEEAKAAKEAAKMLAQAESERRAFETALEKARAEMAVKLQAKVAAEQMRLRSHLAQSEELRAQSNAQQAELDAYEMKLKALEAQLEDAKSKERAVSQAQLTKRGHVYIISNIGSFGEGVYKIGMTRRLDPTIRVHELGGASVPFQFDTHAMIYSEDAPALEAELHRRFDHRRINRVNNRREFFRVSLKEIEQAVAEIHSDEIDFIHEPEAKEFFLSQTQAAAQAPRASTTVR